MKTKRLFPLTVTLLSLVLLSSGLFAQSSDLETEDQKLLYTIGLALAQNVGPLGLSAEDLAFVEQGLRDGVLKKETKVSLQEYGPKLNEFAQKRAAKISEGEKMESAAFLDKMAAQEGAVKKESGLIIQEITPGTGASPTASDRVKVHYHGTLRDGTVFDSSVERGEPATFGLTQVIACWTEGLQLMKVGGKSRLYCPSDLAYGDQGRPGIPPGAALVFEVELLSIENGSEGSGGS